MYNFLTSNLCEVFEIYINRYTISSAMKKTVLIHILLGVSIIIAGCIYSGEPARSQNEDTHPNESVQSQKVIDLNKLIKPKSSFTYTSFEDISAADLDEIYGTQFNLFSQFVSGEFVCNKGSNYCPGRYYIFEESCANDITQAEEKVHSFISYDSRNRDDILSRYQVSYTKETERFYEFKATGIISIPIRYYIFKCRYFEPVEFIYDPIREKLYLDHQTIGKFEEDYGNSSEMKYIVEMLINNGLFSSNSQHMIHHDRNNNNLTVVIFNPGGSHGAYYPSVVSERTYSVDDTGEITMKIRNRSIETKAYVCC